MPSLPALLTSSTELALRLLQFISTLLPHTSVSLYRGKVFPTPNPSVLALVFSLAPLGYSCFPSPSHVCSTFALCSGLFQVPLVTSLLVSLFIPPLPVQFSLPATLSFSSSLCLLYPLYLPQKSPHLWNSHGLRLSLSLDLTSEDLFIQACKCLLSG